LISEELFLANLPEHDDTPETWAFIEKLFHTGKIKIIQFSNNIEIILPIETDVEDFLFLNKTITVN